MRCGLVTCMCSAIGFIVGFILLVAGFLMYSQFESIFGSTVRQQMYIDDQVYWWYDVWLQPPARETLTVHIFEVENAQEWRRNPSRTRPQLRVIGPFVFRVNRTKENVHFASDDHQQISFEERTTYQFDELLSYESLDETATVVNAELMILNPFILAMTRRASAVKRISTALNSSINQMLGLYEANIFIERPVRRVMFGPSGIGTLGDFGSSQPLPTIAGDTAGWSPGTNSVDYEYTNDSLSMMKMQYQTANSEATFGPGSTAGVDDEATLAILKEYDKVGQYLQKLGVDINPYELLAAQMGKQFKNSAALKTAGRLQDSDGATVYQFNSMMAFFQNNSLQKFDLYTGKESDMNGQIIRWNNENKMDAWFSRTCNEINGTDGRQYGPFLRAKRISEFNPRICRSIPLKLMEQGATPNQGVNYFRFGRSNEFMQSPVKYQPNGCYCRWWDTSKKSLSLAQLAANNKRCNYDGILDLGSCYSGGLVEASGDGNGTTSKGHSITSPVILSNPHFSGPITKSITKEVGGLTPDENIYSSYVDVEPVSGIVLNRANKFQFNLHVRPLPLQLGSNRTLREMIMPLFWYEELWTVSPEHQNHIKYFFVYPLKYQELAIFGLIGAGLMMMIFGLLCLCCCCFSKSKKTPDFTKNKKSSGKVSPDSGQNPPIEQVKNGEPPLMVEEYDDNGQVATFGNQWGVRGGPNNYPPPPDDNYPDLMEETDPIMMMQQDNAAYFENQNYVEDQMMQQQAAMQMQQRNSSNNNNSMRGQMVMMVPNGYGVQQQQPGGGGGGQQYPLERLKRNMPAKQSASTYSMRTLQPQNGGQMQPMMGPQQRQRWNQAQMGYDEINNDDYDQYYPGVEGAQANMRAQYELVNGNKGNGDYFYRNDSGNDSWNSGKGSGPDQKSNKSGPNGTPPQALPPGAVGYYETYDDNGRPRPPFGVGHEIYQNEPYDAAYQNGHQRGGNCGGGGPPPPPPPPPPNGGSPDSGPRENLMNEIRQGTVLRKTSPPEKIELQEIIQATSVAVVTSVLQHLELQKQAEKKKEEEATAAAAAAAAKQSQEALNLELLNKILAINSPGASNVWANSQLLRPTNNFIININGTPPPGQNPFGPDPAQMMQQYLAGVMGYQGYQGNQGYQGYQGYSQPVQQQPAITMPQHMALMNLLQQGVNPFAGNPGYAQPQLLPPPQPPPMMVYPSANQSNPNFPSLYQQESYEDTGYPGSNGPAAPIAALSIQETKTQMMMSQQQAPQQQQPQQQFMYQRYETRMNASEDNPHWNSSYQQQTISQPDSSQSSTPDNFVVVESGNEQERQLPLPPPPQRQSQDPKLPDVIPAPESIKFFGPYRAYYEPPNPRNRTGTAKKRSRSSRRPETGGWDTSFDDDTSSEDEQLPPVRNPKNPTNKKKFV